MNKFILVDNHNVALYTEGGKLITFDSKEEAEQFKADNNFSTLTVAEDTVINQ